MTDDDWLEEIPTLAQNIEECCGWRDCTAVALFQAIMSRPCAHRWAFCVWHKDSMTERQNKALAAIDQDTGEWTCPVGGDHKVGLVTRWERARG